MIGLHISRLVRCLAVRSVVFRSGAVFLIILTVATMVTAPLALAQGSQNPDPSAVEAQVKKFGMGKEVKVKLVDGRKLRGHIASIAENSFTLKSGKSRPERRIPYNQVLQIKDPGPITWILIGAAAAIIIIVIATR